MLQRAVEEDEAVSGLIMMIMVMILSSWWTWSRRWVA